MIQTFEAIIGERGEVRLLEPIQIEKESRALVTILGEPPSGDLIPIRTASGMEEARPQEDMEWALLAGRSLAGAYGDSEPEYTAEDLLP